MHIKKLIADSNWKERLESIGYGYHSDGNVPYWIDHYYYEISESFADRLYKNTYTLWEMCLEAVEYVINNNLYHQFHIPNFMIDHIKRTWEQDEPSIYGRFDFAYDSHTDLLKLLEFNADTPTSLFESAIVQYYWKNHYFSEEQDQYNSIHEQLIHTWSELKQHLKGDILYFTCVRESLEDLTNVEYLRDTAIQAGLNTELLYIDEIGWNGKSFTDIEDRPIQSIFKLYPWEWMVNEEFGKYITEDVLKTFWIEPSWKMILSNKAILAILWKLFPQHPLLLEAHLDTPSEMNAYVKKPLLSREGANISMFYNNQMVYETDGEYGEEGYVYQEIAKLHQEDTGVSIIGSWIIGQEPCGISFRESDMPITTDKSRFIPHIIK